MKGKIVAVCISKNRGTKKKSIKEAILLENKGIKGDAHQGPGYRQVSLLAEESIQVMRRKLPQIKPGDFAENLTTTGIYWPDLDIGTKVEVGKDVLLEITQIGKECHNRCAIYYQVGDCVMPREGVFAKVIKGGKVKVGDEIRIRV